MAQDGPKGENARPTDRREWPKWLYETGRLDELERLAVSDLPTMGWPHNDVQDFQTWRMKGLLKAGKKEQALQAAKVLYNVARFKTTTVAVKEIAECLAAAHPAGEKAAREFRLQQMWASMKPKAEVGVGGAGGATSRPANAPKNPLAEIVVDGSEYEPALATARQDSSVSGLCRQAQVYLLIDEPDEAEKLLLEAFGESMGEEKAHVAEDLCRAMRAVDGGTGRALAWLEGLDR